MTPDALAELILTLPDARLRDGPEGKECLVKAKVFAIIGEDTLTLKLTEDQQLDIARSEPDRYGPKADGWGAHGWTEALISTLDETSALAGLMVAWSNAAPDRPKTRPAGPVDFWTF